MKEVVGQELETARKRSIDLLSPIPDQQLVKQHSPLMSPLAWDLAHVGNYEELWLLRSLGGEPVRPEYDDIYNAFRHPRADRPSLDMLPPAQARSYVATVRGRVLDLLDRSELPPLDGVRGEAEPAGRRDRLLADGFVYGMVAQHEHQHDETMLATVQLSTTIGTQPRAQPLPPGSAPEAREVLVDGGSFAMGTDTEPWAYDNERPSHAVELAPYWIDTVPVTNGEYLAFMREGGYDEAGLWTGAGWEWKHKERIAHPAYWRPEGAGSWSVRRFGTWEPLAPDQPVQHVCWYEADAYARWAGKRLPSEGEWEKAASWTSEGVKMRYPWGDDNPGPAVANLGQRHLGPAPIGAYPEGVSPWGCHQMLGDVWEWTASTFLPYPGFASFPYREYSEVFFGDEYKVLRGGSWATHPTAVRATFRNWDFPIRRQIFAGFRCARDA